MNRCAYQENCSNNNAFASIGDFRMRGSSISDGVVCPKPRRIGLFNPSIYQMDICDSITGSELLDMILTKGSYGVEKSNYQVPSSPPFFMGSPPSRASNPVIQDAHFGIDKPNTFTPAPEASPSSQRKNGGCARVKFGQKPAAVRIEGFNCRGNCSISAVA